LNATHPALSNALVVRVITAFHSSPEQVRASGIKQTGLMLPT
jgi:hypothetical protein